MSLPTATASKFEAVASLAEEDVDAAHRALDLAKWDDSPLGTTSSGAPGDAISVHFLHFLLCVRFLHFQHFLRAYPGFGATRLLDY